MPKFFGRFSSSECKTQAKLCSGRIRLMRNKRQIAMAQTRKEVAELLRTNKQENARIRVESVVRDINLLQAYDVLEIFLEMLTVRLQLIEKSKDVPQDMFECLASLIYSSSRIQDFPELSKIRDMLGRKFGQEFVEKCSADSTCRQFMVNENLIQFLAISAPDPDLKLQILSDIAQQHEVEWDSHRAHQEMLSGSYAPRFGAGPPGPPGNGGFSGNGGFQGPPNNFGGGNFGGGGGGGGGGGRDGAQITQPPSPLFQPPPTDFAGPSVQSSQPSESKFQRNLKNLVSLGKKSTGGSGEWADAPSAAAAAREYSQNAQRAADAAQRFANPEGGYNVQSSGNSNPQILPPAGPQYRPISPANPQYPDLGRRPESSPPRARAPGGAQDRGAPFQAQPPNFNPMTSALNQGKETDANEPTKPDQAPLPPGQYRQRSDEDIQRAYDAAGGPPAKKGAPSAPPAGNNPPAPSDDAGLPSPPNAGGIKKSGGSGGIDDDLAARFEALKKG